MKTLKFAVLILIVLIVNSCDKDKIDKKTLGYQHLLLLSFQDVSGNDLLEGSEFIWNDGMSTTKPEFYTLDIVFEDGIPNKYEIYKSDRYDIRYPMLSLANKWFLPPESPANPDYKYLCFEASSFRSSFAEKITFRLICPYLFGDNEAHDIVTWWEPSTYRGYGRTFCYRIEFEGKEFPVEGNDVVNEFRVATIILDK